MRNVLRSRNVTLSDGCRGAKTAQVMNFSALSLPPLLVRTPISPLPLKLSRVPRDMEFI